MVKTAVQAGVPVRSAAVAVLAVRAPQEATTAGTTRSQRPAPMGRAVVAGLAHRVSMRLPLMPQQAALVRQA